MNDKRVMSLAVLSLSCLLASGVDAAPPASSDLIAARTLFFGAENVDQKSGQVDNQKVVFSWITNTS
jgi:hypothetical protein